jgi:hypothetical protein
MTTRPRSAGVSLLATDAKLDMTLIRLDTVPTGAYGRTYLGWDTRQLVRNDDVCTIHFPDATPMRVSRGDVRGTGRTLGGRNHLTEVLWSEGVTEQGSSGACLLLRGNARIVGALSQGAQHTCGWDRSGNLDWFGSFRDFYPKVQPYVDSATPASGPGADDCRNVSVCPFSLVFADQSALLQDFRSLRDGLLRAGVVGQGLVKTYYRAAPQLARAVQQSAAARGTFIALTAPWARLGAWLR